MTCELRRGFLGKEFAAVVLLAGATDALAHFDDQRDGGLNAHQTQLDEQYARGVRTQPTLMPDPPARYRTPYGYVPQHRPIAKRRHGTNGLK
jgi:hypothetical protein